MRKKTFVPLLPDAVAMGHIGYGAWGSLAAEDTTLA